MKKIISLFLALVLILGMIMYMPERRTIAASKPTLKVKKAVITLDETGYIVKVLNASKKSVIRFYSSDKEVLKVAKKTGRVTPVSEGTAKVTVKIKQNGKTIKLKQKITVKPALGSGDSGNDSEFTIKEFSLMLSDVIKKADKSLLPEWEELAVNVLNNNDKLRRNDAKLILYEAACVLGIGHYATQYWCEYQQAYDQAGIYSSWTVNEKLFANVHNTAPWETFRTVPDNIDYIAAALSYSNGKSSSASEEAFFKRLEKSGDDEEVIDEAEGKTAAERLYEAYCCYHEGYFDINDYATDWSDPALKEAATLKDSIINSKTLIKKSDTFIQGETYTGTAYYVSNSGDDTNDGLSPDTAWASMEKVTEAKLEFGDAVFFERGGRWYGRLQMQDGVTYSAYGEGAKPVWSGSPLDAGKSSNWEYYTSTVDGGKIWRYKEKQYSCGIILLDEHIVARNMYPFWDGDKYCIPDGTRAFSIADDLYSDLMFCSLVELDGIKSPCRVWDQGRKGYIYLRCDRGNPGNVFSTIELGVGYDLITTANGGGNTVDNICYRCFTGGGLDCNCHDNIIYQNCESCWHGGGVGYYQYDNGHPITVTSAGGMLLFGKHEIGRNNYIHDCENKGIAVVINGDGHASLERKNVLAENNVVERCGRSVYMMTEFVPEGEKTVMEDIYFKNNYFINTGKGWRAHNEMWLGNGNGTSGSDCEAISLLSIHKTGEVLFDGNLFYKPRGACMLTLFVNNTRKVDHASYKNNKFVLEPGSPFYTDALFGDSSGESYEFHEIYKGTETDEELNKALNM